MGGIKDWINVHIAFPVGENHREMKTRGSVGNQYTSFSLAMQVHGKLKKPFCDTASVSFCSLACHFAHCCIILLTVASFCLLLCRVSVAQCLCFSKFYTLHCSIEHALWCLACNLNKGKISIQCVS